MEVFREFADKFEQTSIDEAFLDISQRCSDYDQSHEHVSRAIEEPVAAHGCERRHRHNRNEDEQKVLIAVQKVD